MVTVMPTVLHTADWHLGRTLNRFDLQEQQREALESLIAIVERESPDLVVIAGDVFDTPDRQPLAAIRTWTWFTDKVQQRFGERVPIVVIPGNHDHPDRLGYNANLTQRSGLYVLHDLTRAHVPLEIAGIEIFGVPFHRPPRVRALAPEGSAAAALDDFDYDGAMRHVLSRCLEHSSGRWPRLVVAHAFVAGAGDEDSSEEPLMVGGSGSVSASAFDGFDYVALGHLHTPRGLPGRAHVRYAGSLYPYAFDEAGEKGVTLLRWDDGAGPGTAPEITALPLPVQRRVRVLADLSFEAVLQAGEELRERGDPSLDDFVLVSVSDRNPIPHAQARLSEVYPNAVFEQRRIDVPADESFQAPDPATHSLEEVFEAFYRHVYGADEALDDLERATLYEALARLGEGASE